MKVGLTLLCTMCLLGITACVSMGNGFYYPVNHATDIVVNPPIGIVREKSLGEPIIESGKGYFSRAIEIENSTHFKDFTKATMFVNSGIYEFVGEKDSYVYYFPTSPDQIVYINSSGDPISQYEYAIRIGKDSTIEVMGSPYGGTKMKGSEHFSKTLKYTEIDSCFIANKDSFQQTLIYNGKDQNTLKFSYREYSNSQIRDAFTTNVTYDLNESNVIGYKNFKAEIIEADNMRIRYKIISGF